MSKQISFVDVFDHIDRQVNLFKTSPSQMITLDAKIASYAKKQYEEMRSKKNSFYAERKNTFLLVSALALNAGVQLVNGSYLFAIASLVACIAFFAISNRIAKKTQTHFEHRFIDIATYMKKGDEEIAILKIASDFDVSSKAYASLSKNPISKIAIARNLADLAAKNGNMKILLYLSMIMDDSCIRNALLFAKDKQMIELIRHLDLKGKEQPLVSKEYFKEACKVENYDLVAFFIDEGFYPDGGIRFALYEEEYSIKQKLNEWEKNRNQTDLTAFEYAITLMQFNRDRQHWESFLKAFHISQTIDELVLLDNDAVYLTINSQNIRVGKDSSSQLKELFPHLK